MKILGICGGIGSGKSTACQLMVDSLGCVARIGKCVVPIGVVDCCSNEILTLPNITLHAFSLKMLIF